MAKIAVNRPEWRLRVLVPAFVGLMISAAVVWRGHWLDYSGGAILSVLTGAALIAAGVRMGEVHYGSMRAGLATALAGATWPWGWLLVSAAHDQGAGAFVGWIYSSLNWLPLVYILNVFPSDIPEDRSPAATRRRSAVLMTFAFVVLGPVNLAMAMVSLPQDAGLVADVWWPTIWQDADAYAYLHLAYGFGNLVLAVLVLQTLRQRLRAAAMFDRSVRLPVLVGACVAAMVAATGAALEAVFPPTSDTFRWLFTAHNTGLMAFPLAIFAGEARLRRRRRWVIEEIADLPVLTSQEVEKVLTVALLDPSVRIVLWDPRWERVFDGRPLMDDVSQDAGEEVEVFRNRVVVPLTEAGGQPVGWITVDARLHRYPELLTAAATAARLPIQLLRAQAVADEQYAELEGTLQRLIQDERRRIGDTLHDEFQQPFAALAIRVGVAEAALKEHPVARSLRGIRRDLGEANTALRRYAKGQLVEVAPMSAILAGLQRNGAVDVQVENTVDDFEFDERQCEQIRAVLSEALANTLKHAEASRVLVTVRREGQEFVIVYKDFGRGGVNPRGTGMLGMQIRLKVLAGVMHVDSPPGEHTVLNIRFPAA